MLTEKETRRLVATGEAQKRTKNRLREHNLVTHNPEVVFVDALKGWGILAECVDHCNWKGWIPSNEVRLD